MDVVTTLSNPGAVIGTIGGAIAVGLPLASTIASLLLTKLPPPKNLRTGYAVLYTWLEYASLSFGNGKTALRAQMNGEVAPVLPAPVVAPPPAPTV